MMEDGDAEQGTSFATATQEQEEEEANEADKEDSESDEYVIPDLKPELRGKSKRRKNSSGSPPPPVLLPEIKTKRIIKPPSRLNQYDISQDPFLYEDDDEEEEDSRSRKRGRKKRSKLLPPELIKQEPGEGNLSNEIPKESPKLRKRAVLPAGTRDLVKDMARRGHALFIGGDLKWVGMKAADLYPKNPASTCYEIVEPVKRKNIDDKTKQEQERMRIMGNTVIRTKESNSKILVPRAFAIEPTPEMRMKKYQQRKMKENKLLHAKKMKKIVKAMRRKTKKTMRNNTNYSGSDASGSCSDSDYISSDEGDESDIIVRHIGRVWAAPDEIYERFFPTAFKIKEAPKVKRSRVTAVAHTSQSPQPRKSKPKSAVRLTNDGRPFNKPMFSYSCLVALALKNADGYCLPVSEIYRFMCDHFPYFYTAPGGWKNSVRHNLSLNKCFEKREKPGSNGSKKGCLWALIVDKMHKMDEEIQKWLRKDTQAIRMTMSDPENLEQIERGEFRKDYGGMNASDDEDDDDESPEGNATDIKTEEKEDAEVEAACELFNSEDVSEYNSEYLQQTFFCVS